MISYFNKICKRNWCKKLIVGLLVAGMPQRSSAVVVADDIAIGMAAAAIVPLILSGSIGIADQMSQASNVFNHREPIQADQVLAGQLPGFGAQLLMQTTAEDVKKTQQMIEYFENGTKALVESPENSNALVQALEEEMCTVSKNLNCSEQQVRDNAKSFLTWMERQQLAHLKDTDHKAWLDNTQSSSYQKRQDSYYLKNQMISDSYMRVWFYQFELQKQQTNTKIINGTAATLLILYKALNALLVAPLKSIAYETKQDHAVTDLLQSNPVLHAAYKHTAQYVLNQALVVTNSTENYWKRAENLLLLNQANMEGKFGRNCRRLTAQLNYLFCDTQGNIDFSKFNDKSNNDQAALLLEEFFRYTADNHEAYVEYCTSAAQYKIPGMQKIVTQAAQGTRFSVGQSTFSKWNESVLGKSRRYIDPVDVSAKKLNNDFLIFTSHLRANEFDIHADMNLNYWQAWQLKNKYMRLSALSDGPLKQRIHDQAIAMHNLFGDYYHKNRAKYNCWDRYDCEVYIDQSGVLRAYPKELNELAKQYGLTRSHILYLNRAYNLSPESLAEICADQSKKALLEQLVKEVKKDYRSKTTEQSIEVKEIVDILRAEPSIEKMIEDSAIYEEVSLCDFDVESLPENITYVVEWDDEEGEITTASSGELQEIKNLSDNEKEATKDEIRKIKKYIEQLNREARGSGPDPDHDDEKTKKALKKAFLATLSVGAWKKISKIFKRKGLDIKASILQTKYHPISVRLEHVSGLDIRVRYIRNNLYGFKITGTHLDRLGLFEKNGILNLDNIKHYENGYYVARTNFMGTYKTCSYYPKHWKDKDILKCYSHVFNNPINAYIDQEKMHIIGLYESHITKLVIDPKRDLITGYFCSNKKELLHK